MGERIYRLLTRGVEDLHKAAYLLGVFSLFSQILALVRDRLLASTFGAGETLDIYYAAFRIPDLIYVAIASVVSLAALVPFLVGKIRKNRSEAKEFINGVFTYFSIIIVVVSATVAYFMPQIVPKLFPGFEGEAMENLIMLSRILLLQPIFLGLSSLFAGITQVFKKFVVYSIGLLLYNVGIIFGLLFLFPHFGLAGLGMGVVLGAILQVLIQIPAVRHEGFMPRPALSLKSDDAKKVLSLSLPRTLTLSASQIVMLILVSMASQLESGSIAVFMFAFNLQSVPLTIIGVSYSVAAFPTLAELYSDGKREAFAKQVASAARHIIFWSLPSMAIFIVLRAQIVRVILGSGEFGWSDTRLTAAILAIFSISIVAQALTLLFVRGYYAAGKTYRPLVINVLSSVGIVVGAIALMRLFENNAEASSFVGSLFRVDDVPGTRVLALAISYSVGQLINALLLWYFFARDFKEFIMPIKAAFLHSAIASIVMGVVAYYCLGIFDDLFNINTFFGILFQGALSGLIGIVAGVLLLNAFNNREIKEIQRTLRSRFSRRDVIATDERM